jgi:NADH-quinone oxidoreductase subunit K
MHLSLAVGLSALLFGAGVYGVLGRRNAVAVLMAVELMLNAANLDLVAFDAWFKDTLHSGQVFALFVVVIAAAEVGVGLAIVLSVFRLRETVAIDTLTELAERDPRPVEQRDPRPVERRDPRPVAEVDA